MKNLIRIVNILMLLNAVLFLSQCRPSESSGEDEHDHQEEGQEEGHGEDVVELSDIQVAAADLKYGTFDSLNISGFVKSNGHLDLPPKNIAGVSAPMAGFVKQANFLVGDYVKKGSALAILEHPDYIEVQKEYLELLSSLDYLKAEWHRQRVLDSAQVTARKQFQQAEANYKSALVRSKSLEKQLAYLGFSPDQVAQGNISTTLAIRAPLSGYITQLNVHNGEFVRSEQELYELVDNEHMHIELNVFEQDIYKVKVGQAIRFTVPSIGSDSYRGDVFLVGKSFDRESKTVRVHGHIKGDHSEFIRGLFVEANIYTGDQLARVLPEEAVVQDEGNSFIFARAEEAHDDEEEGHAETEETHEHGTSFHRIQVVTGVKDQGFVEITQISDLHEDAAIVTEGAYFLLSEMKKGEGGHHH